MAVYHSILSGLRRPFAGSHGIIRWRVSYTKETALEVYRLDWLGTRGGLAHQKNKSWK